VRRESTLPWYWANAEALQELLGFLYAECCMRNKAIEPQTIVWICKGPKDHPINTKNAKEVGPGEIWTGARRVQSGACCAISFSINWARADVFELFSNNVGPFSFNVSRRASLFSVNLGQKERRFRVRAFMLSSRYR